MGNHPFAQIYLAFRCIQHADKRYARFVPLEKSENQGYVIFGKPSSQSYVSVFPAHVRHFTTYATVYFDSCFLLLALAQKVSQLHQLAVDRLRMSFFHEKKIHTAAI